MKLVSNYEILDQGWLSKSKFYCRIGIGDTNSFLTIRMSNRANFQVQYANTVTTTPFWDINPEIEVNEHYSDVMDPKTFYNFIESDNRFKHLNVELWKTFVIALIQKQKVNAVQRVMNQLGIKQAA